MILLEHGWSEQARYRVTSHSKGPRLPELGEGPGVLIHLEKLSGGSVGAESRRKRWYPATSPVPAVGDIVFLETTTYAKWDHPA